MRGQLRGGNSQRGSTLLVDGLLPESGSWYTVYCILATVCSRQGHGDASTVMLPRLVSSLKAKKMVGVCAGEEHSMGCTSEGELYSWGGVVQALTHRVSTTTAAGVASASTQVSAEGRSKRKRASKNSAKAAAAAADAAALAGTHGATSTLYRPSHPMAPSGLGRRDCVTWKVPGGSGTSRPWRGLWRK